MMVVRIREKGGKWVDLRDIWEIESIRSGD